VSDPVSTARTARESLARGLNALQSDPNIPPQLLDLAAPIAQAMGALHAIERSNGSQLSPHAEVALNHTRSALSQLQAQPPAFPAVTQAMEAVAASLASVHALSKMGPPACRPAACGVCAGPVRCGARRRECRLVAASAGAAPDRRRSGGQRRPRHAERDELL